MTELPEIRLSFSPMLYDFVSRDAYKIHAKEWDGIPSMEACEEWTENYRQAWAEYEEKILRGITEALGVQFRQPIIDAHTAPGIRAMSDPLILNFMFYPDQFVDSLTHELIHVLLTDNDKYSLKDTVATTRLDTAWTKMFGTHDFETLVHIPVHALHKYIYLDVLNEPDRLERDKKTAAEDPAYVRAWEYVENHNYHELIAQLGDFYQQIQE